MVQSPPTLITSVIKALTLLDAIGDEHGSVPAKKLARLTGLPLPTTYHLLRTLLHEGYVERRDGGYLLGDRVATLARQQQRSAVAGESRAVLQRLHHQSHAAAYLATLDDGRVRVVDIVDSAQAPRIDVWADFDDSAHATAFGKAMLACLPDDQRRDYLSNHPLVDLTGATVTSSRVLLQQLQHHPEVATDDQEYALGVACLAVSVPTTTRVCAVAVSVPADRRDRLTGIEPSVREAAVSLALACNA